MFQIRQHLFQLQEQALAGCVAVGVHVEGEAPSRPPPIGGGVKGLEQSFVLLAQQRGGGDGDDFVTRREHGPTVAAALGDVELVARLEEVQHGQVLLLLEVITPSLTGRAGGGSTFSGTLRSSCTVPSGSSR